MFLGDIGAQHGTILSLGNYGIIPVFILSDGMGAVESQPDLVQKLTLALLSQHFLAFAKAVAFAVLV